MSFITRFSLDTNRLTIVFIGALIIIGLSQFFSFPRQEDPPIVIREVVVTAFRRIAATCREAPLRLAHRDFQSANLHVRSAGAHAGRLVMIDLQGALLAPPAAGQDLALLEFDEPLDFSSSVRPAVSRVRATRESRCSSLKARAPPLLP